MVHLKAPKRIQLIHENRPFAVVDDLHGAHHFAVGVDGRLRLDDDDRQIAAGEGHVVCLCWKVASQQQDEWHKRFSHFH